MCRAIKWTLEAYSGPLNVHLSNGFITVRGISIFAKMRATQTSFGIGISFRGLFAAVSLSLYLVRSVWNCASDSMKYMLILILGAIIVLNSGQKIDKLTQFRSLFIGEYCFCVHSLSLCSSVYSFTSISSSNLIYVEQTHRPHEELFGN